MIPTNTQHFKGGRCNLLDVVGIGVPCVDLVVNVDRVPLPNESLRMNNHSWQGGGVVPTALVTASKLGSKAGVICIVGDDNFGRFIVEDFERYGVDCSQIIVEQHKSSPFSVVISDEKTAGRSIIGNLGTVSDLTEDDVDWAYIFNSKVLLVSGSTAIDLKACKEAQKKGVSVVVDADGFSQRMLELAPYVDYFVASEEFAEGFAPGQSAAITAQQIGKLGPKVVVITLGSQGCVLRSRDKTVHIPAFSVEVQDTLGAGDVFHGAFIHAVLQKWSMEKACRFANAVSALKCTQIGGRSGIPRFQEVQEFISSGKISLQDARSLQQLYQRMP
jgi:sulfofructose kinase